jgi:hypothetical protein
MKVVRQVDLKAGIRSSTPMRSSHPAGRLKVYQKSMKSCPILIGGIQIFLRFQELPVHLIVSISVIPLRQKRFNASGGQMPSVMLSDSALCDHAAIEIRVGVALEALVFLCAWCFWYAHWWSFSLLSSVTGPTGPTFVYSKYLSFFIFFFQS